MRQAVLANTAALIGGLVAFSPSVSPLVAQAAPSACQVDQNKPKELTLAYLTYTKLSAMPAGPARDPHLKSMLKDLLDKPEKYASNLAGYNYMLTLGLTAAATQPGGVSPTTRGAMGLTTRPTEEFDAITELDKAYKGWEAAMPACAPDIAAARNSEAWLAVTNAAFGFVTKQPNDSAVYFANKSILLSPKNAFAHHILAEVAKSKNDNAGAMAEWKKVIEQAGTDTGYKDIRQNALFYVGLYELQDAAKASGEAAKTQAKSAAGYFREFLKVNPNGPDAASVMNNLAQALQVADDKEGLKAMYMEMVADPSKYNESLLATGGVIAAGANDMVNAGKLFAGMVAVNPRSRDGLRNLASTLHDQGRFLEMYPPLRTLVEVDPNNFDGWMLFAHAAAGMEKTVKTPAEKKQWTDTLTKYAGLADKLNARVEVTGFTRGLESSDITMIVEHVGATPADYTVSVDFLDASGAVIGSASEQTGSLKKNEKKTITVKAPVKGVIAFRYKSLG